MLMLLHCSLMFVNLNPRVEAIDESLNSLRFAATANQCKIGRAKRAKTVTKK
jgi:hypothetical protein